MTILSDGDIKKHMEAGDLNITPFIERNLTPNGYDLSIDEVVIGNKMYDSLPAKIPELTWFAISTKEKISMGKLLTAQLWIRSTYARRGIIASFGKVDAGFNGTLTISCFNANRSPVFLPIGNRFCQIIFEELSSIPEELYEQKSGNYQNQQGVQLQSLRPKTPFEHQIISMNFNIWSNTKMHKGNKCATTRTKKKGKIGDVFYHGEPGNVRAYVLDLVVELPLWFISKELYISEGAESPAEFEKVWKEIYGDFKPYQNAWYHHFRESRV